MDRGFTQLLDIGEYVWYSIGEVNISICGAKGVRLVGNWESGGNPEQPSLL